MRWILLFVPLTTGFRSLAPLRTYAFIKLAPFAMTSVRISVCREEICMVSLGVNTPPYLCDLFGFVRGISSMFIFLINFQVMMQVDPHHASGHIATGYNNKTNSWHCTRCGVDMGINNPRQLCKKWFCEKKSF